MQYCKYENLLLIIIRMWASAQRNDRPAEYVAPSVQRRKVWLTRTTRVPCNNAISCQFIIGAVYLAVAG